MAVRVVPDSHIFFVMSSMYVEKKLVTVSWIVFSQVIYDNEKRLFFYHVNTITFRFRELEGYEWRFHVEVF